MPIMPAHLPVVNHAPLHKGTKHLSRIATAKAGRQGILVRVLLEEVRLTAESEGYQLPTNDKDGVY